MALRFASTTHIETGQSPALARFRGARDNAKTDNTKNRYDSRQKEFVSWLSARGITLTCPDDMVDRITLEHVEEFLGSLTYKKGPKKGQPAVVHTLGMYRSAIRNLFLSNNIPWLFEEDLKESFKGLKKELGTMRQTGVMPAREGKAPLSFDVYRTICSVFLLTYTQDIKMNYSFAHAYLTLCWNLVSRTSMVSLIQLSHLSWINDALAVIVPTHKADKDGSRASTSDPRHVFANPLQPKICPILALGIYLLCTPLTVEDSYLFPGGSQNKHFFQLLKESLSTPAVRDVLSGVGLDPSDIAAHSARKGGVTYASSGSTSGPSIVPLLLRGFWALGGVQDRYFRFERAGDQFCGRVLSGLPQEQSEFGILPPHFCLSSLPTSKSTTVAEAVRNCFPRLYELTSLRKVLHFCLASVVYHHDYLVNNLPSSHPLFNSPLFALRLRGRVVIDALKELVHTGYQCNSLSATGLPGHTAVLSHCKELAERMDRLEESMLRAVNGVVGRVENVLEQYGTIRGNASGELIEEKMMACLQKVGIVTMAQQWGNGKDNSEESDDVMEAHKGALELLCRQGLPQNFQLKATLNTAWQLWWIGNATFKLPPYRQLHHAQMNRNLSKRYYEWKKVMAHMMDILKRMNLELHDKLLSSKNLTCQFVDQCYKIVQSHLPHEAAVSSSSKRRPAQLKVSTVYKYMSLQAAKS